jgi:ABC-2 type transport system permease protein
MNTQSSALPESFDAPKVAPQVMSTTRPLYWSVRRELWEYRSIYLAPLAAAGVYLLAYVVGAMRLPHKLRGLSALEPMARQHAIAEPYDFAAGLMMVTAMIVGVIYCLDALHGERRDRSILFWKSLPVSDVTTVLAKASIPLAVLPVLTITITLAMQLLMLLMSSMALAASGQSVGAYWEQLSWFQMWAMLVYHLLTVHLLGHAPFYAWFLLVSAWARRAAFLWAVLPLVALGFIEKIVFNTSYFGEMLVHQLSGGSEAVPFPGRMPIDPMTHLTPGHFLISPGLWIGLAVTAAFLFAAVQVRRNREPI